MYVRAAISCGLCFLLALPPVLAAGSGAFGRVEAAAAYMAQLRRDVNDQYQILLNTTADDTIVADQTARLDTLAHQVSALDDIIARMQGRVAALEQQMSTLARELGVAMEQAALDTALGRASTVSRTIDQLRGRYVLLRHDLGTTQEQLRVVQASRAELLHETAGEEAAYAEILTRAQAEQLAAEAAIAATQAEIATLTDVLTDIEAGSAGELSQLIRQQVGGGDDFVPHTPRLAWPVDPARGITAQFRDPAYLAYFGIPHNAVDIRLAQGSPIYAAAPGVVLDTFADGTRYAYIVLAHAGELSTVYGHVSEIVVAEGDVVRAGDIIAHSGGMPGTAGAGRLSTGPHLHFEVFDTGTHVDPLDYLPLAPMRVQDVPERFFR